VGFRQGVNDWLSIILKGIVIFIVIVGVLWLGLSVWGNLAEKSPAAKLPTIDKAPIVFTITNTGQQVLAKNYTTESDGRYTLHGFYNMEKGKWKWRSDDLTIDPFYFGKITILRRE